MYPWAQKGTIRGALNGMSTVLLNISTGLDSYLEREGIYIQLGNVETDILQ